jgi:hypothetical protein
MAGRFRGGGHADGDEPERIRGRADPLLAELFGAVALEIRWLIALMVLRCDPLAIALTA